MTKVNIKLIQKVFFNASSKKCQIPDDAKTWLELQDKLVKLFPMRKGVYTAYMSNAHHTAKTRLRDIKISRLEKNKTRNQHYMVKQFDFKVVLKDFWHIFGSEGCQD